MSYWSISILGGPEALSILARLEDALGVPRGALYPLEGIEPALRRDLQHRLDASFKPVQTALGAVPRQQRQVAAQVAAALVMAVGAKLPPSFRHTAMAALRQDPYARKNPERKLEMEAMRRRLSTYVAGTPNPVGEELLTIATGKRILARMPQPYLAEAKAA